MKLVKLFTLLVAGMLLSSQVFATETNITIRAKAVDAKFIGTSVGGLRVVVTDTETGKILDTGWIRGGTGSTDTIIKNPITRGQSIADENTARFVAKVDISSPRLVKFTVIGPYAYRQSLQEASITSWIIPGKDIMGDGIILSMPGFIIDTWTSVMEGGIVQIFADSAMLCGCKISPNTQWNPRNFEAKAIIMRDGEKITEVKLPFTGPVAIFSGETKIEKPGHYKVIAYIIDQKTGNVGVDRTIFEINEK
jgi:hypothetical protein